jgi:colanic acid/amylovoran biosynthesis glycosyltransferase
MSERTLTTLHLFQKYLSTGQNWAYRMMINLPNCKLKAAAYYYFENEFRTSNIELLPMPSWLSEGMLEGNIAEKRSVFMKPFYKLRYHYLNNRFYKIIASQTEKWNVDLIHCHFANMGWQYLKVKELTGLPFIVSFYGFDYESLPFMYPKWKERYEELFEKADLFICEGHYGASVLRGKGCPESKIRVVHLGVDTHKIPFTHRTKKPNELHLLQLCNFAVKKGQIYSALAFLEAVKTCPDMTLTFVGTQESERIKEKIEQLFKESRNENKLRFIEHIDFSKLYDFMKTYQAFIHPSCYADNRDSEGGAPVVLLDAQGTGMPVISSTHCDIPEEVIHGTTGLLSSEKDVSSITRSIEYFYKMGDNEYQQFALAARKHVENNFEIKKCATSLEKIYRELVGA